MNIGFTGTKRGMTDVQKHVVQRAILFLINKDKWCYTPTFHHGSCIGSDYQAGIIAKSLGCKIILHPPIITRYMAPCYYDEIREPKDYLVRNHDIVDETEVLIATPKEFTEELRSGTWATVRYAKEGKLIIIVYPDGTMNRA